MRPEGREPLPDKAGESTLLSRSGGVKELAVENQFGERSKFQLAEKDLKATMDIVLGSLNDEYQTYKEEHPNNRFFRKGNMAYYYNGDYYDVDILPDGQIGSFYKRIDK